MVAIKKSMKMSVCLCVCWVDTMQCLDSILFLGVWTFNINFKDYVVCCRSFCWMSKHLENFQFNKKKKNIFLKDILNKTFDGMEIGKLKINNA